VSGRAHEEARALADELRAWRGRPLTFMEVCGTHTMAAARAGLRSLLPPTVRLVSGPGCPVCVTPVGYVDHALALAALPGVTIATFGDLLRVPGSWPGSGAPPSLTTAKAAGADVRVCYSPLDALALARRLRDRQVVFLGVGFETTTPTIAAAIQTAAREGLESFTVLGAHKTVPEAMTLLCTAGELSLDGFLCPGHVSVILGPEVYEPLARDHHMPCVIAGFETVEILRGLAHLVRQAAAGEARVENCYPGPVRPGGNPRARAVAAEVFESCDSSWRGLGEIPASGLRIREAFAHFDAARRFDVVLPEPREPRGCRCGDVLRGVLDPGDCPHFGRACTPDTPVGACMVSSEGSCAARYHYGEVAA
jgi:hydrogenase expression/formation protein HypD